MDTASLNALLNSGAILPELIVIGTLVLVLIVDLIASGRKSANVLPYIAIAGLVAATAALVWQWTSLENPIAFLGSFNSDKLSIIFVALFAFSA